MSGPIRRDISGDTRVNEAKEVQSSPENGKKGEINYEKIIELFVNRHSEMMYERHASVLIKLSKIYESGINLNHLQYLAKVITLSTQKILNGANVLINPLYCLLLICLRHAKSITQSGEVECTEYMIALAGVSGIETNENLVDTRFWRRSSSSWKF
ncbi:hypothetical protein BKA69DRAFT_433033 [Paraphysoderma sedebokerense]|nr:hypothetical protein BKA69DRAFT_433033 [Paraphysoderma sedebokerense]